MKFVSRTPREGINVSDEHPLVEATTLVIGLGAVLTALALVIVFFVDLVVVLLPPSIEARFLQNTVMEEFMAADYDSDNARDLQSLVERLATQWPDNPYEFRVGILDNRTPNALALPGGVILVTSGLLEQTKSENELAFVLGHELGHFRNRDHLRQLGRVTMLSLFAVAVLGQNAANLTGNVLNLTILAFNREQESEADEFGLAAVYGTYGHVNEAWRFFERAAEDESALRTFGSFAATHPPSRERLDAMRKMAERNQWPLDGQLTRLPGTNSKPENDTKGRAL